MNTAISTPASAMRTEHDSFGDIEVPAASLWGAQTQRSLAYLPQRLRIVGLLNDEELLLEG
mgnify:CR=1 FL=1